MNDENNQVVKKVVITTRNDNLNQMATQVNSSINEQSVTDVNNQIKVDKKHPIVSFIIVLLTLIVIGVVGYFAVTFVVNKIEDSNTTTTQANLKKERVVTYVNNLDTFRKFESGSKVLLLAPSGYDLKNNTKIAFLLELNNQGITSIDNTIYEISDDNIVLGNGLTFKITEDGLDLDGNTLSIKDGEKKYYTYKTVSETKLLLISSSSIYTFGAFIESNENNLNIMTDSFTESEDFITFENGTVFTKTESGVLINGVTLNLNN